MADYQQKKPVKIERTAGINTSISIRFPVTLPLDPAAVITFGAWADNGQRILTGSNIVINGQLFTIPILGSDTKNKKGFFDYQIRVVQTGMDVLFSGQIELKENKL